MTNTMIIFFGKQDRGAVSLGLFFVNKEDAETYLQEVCKKDPKGAEEIGLNVKTVGLDTFYELNRTSKPRMQAKLIADLEEIDLLLNDYTYTKFCIFILNKNIRNNGFKATLFT